MTFTLNSRKWHVFRVFLRGPVKEKRTRSTHSPKKMRFDIASELARLREIHAAQRGSSEASLRSASFRATYAPYTSGGQRPHWGQRPQRPQRPQWGLWPLWPSRAIRHSIGARRSPAACGPRHGTLSSPTRRSADVIDLYSEAPVTGGRVLRSRSSTRRTVRSSGLRRLWRLCATTRLKVALSTF